MLSSIVSNALRFVFHKDLRPLQTRQRQTNSRHQTISVYLFSARKNSWQSKQREERHWVQNSLFAFHLNINLMGAKDHLRDKDLKNSIASSSGCQLIVKVAFWPMGEFWRENQVVTETGKRTYIFVIRLFYQQFISFLIWTNTFKISIWTIQGAFPSNNVMSSTLKMQTRGRTPPGGDRLIG